MGTTRQNDVAISVADYLYLEARSPVRQEYFRGEIHALSGGTARHSRIATNIIAALVPCARRSGCQVLTSDFNVQPTDQAVYYPDVGVVCGPQDPNAVLTRTPC